MNWRRIRRVIRRVWIGAGVLVTGWMFWAFQSHGVPQDTFASDASVEVERIDGSWRFHPQGTVRRAGLIFLPGGMVDPKAYGPIAREIARAGHPVAVVELPLRMARNAEAETEVRERALAARRALGPELPWVLGGHSRGAAIATRLTAGDPTGYQGLALVGTTHPRMDLSALDVPVVKIGGTRDCVAPRERNEEANLPPSTVWSWIEGANHAQFGYYGPQLGDCGASIPREQQQRELTRLLTALLEEVARAHPR